MPGAELRADMWVCEYVTPWDVYHHGVTRILAAKRTAFQDMQIVETGAFGKGLVLDGKWQSCTGDEFLYHEPLVHPGMIAHGSPKSVLILGGGEGATSREVLRWNTVTRAVMVDIDGDVVEACKEHLPEMHQNSFDDPRHEVIVGDALDVLDTTKDKWDVVISDLADPLEEGPSFKLFTREYYEQVRGVLSPDGVFVLQAGPLSPPVMQQHVRLNSTVRAVFGEAHSYWSFASSYASPWGFILAGAKPVNVRRAPEEVDRQLKAKTKGGFRMFDGIAMVGMFHIPAHIRRAIAAETEVYTLAAPPKFFGRARESK